MVSFKTKSGFSPVALVAIVVVVGLLSFVGYTAYNKINSKKTATAETTAQAPVANDVQPAPAISNSTDLTTAEAALDQTDTSSSTDLTSLDTQLNSF
jgi:hypothetical protein